MSESEERNVEDERAWAEREPQLLEQCVREIPGHGERAFRSLVEHYMSLVHGVALKITGSQEDAEEVAQDTFARVHRKIGRFDRRCAFPTWLISIAKRESFRKLRSMCRRKRRHQAIEREWKQQPETSWPEGSGAVERNPLREVFFACIACLRMEDRRILLLRVDQGLSLTEIADAMGIRLSAAKMRLSRAMRALDKAYHLDLP